MANFSKNNPMKKIMERTKLLIRQILKLNGKIFDNEEGTLQGTCHEVRRKTKCREAITPEERKSANYHYFSLNYKRRSSSSKSKKHFSYRYTLILKATDGKRVEVCKSFFFPWNS